MSSEPYQQNPPRYEYRLTPRGAELKPVLGALAGWAHKHLAGGKADPALASLLRS